MIFGLIFIDEDKIIMPASSEKQRRFFGLVRSIQKGDKSAAGASPAARKVAKSISAKDASDFASSKAESKTKKAVLEMLKNSQEPMYLEEQETNPITKTFKVKGDFEKYVAKYIGQLFSPKELETIDNFQDIKPTKIERAGIRYESTDTFQNTTTTSIKKMKDGGQFSFNAFTKHSKVEPESEQPESLEPNDATAPQEPAPAGLPDLQEWLNELDAAPMEEPKEDIIVTKSTLFDDEVDGAAVLAEFLKKLDL